MTNHRHDQRATVCAAILATIAVLLLFYAPSLSRTVVVRTVLLGLAASAIAFPIAVLVTWSIKRSSTVGRWLLRACIGLALLPVYLNVGCQDAAFGKLGWLTSQENAVLIPVFSGWPAAVWVHATSLVPQFTFLILFFLGQRRNFEEQALTEASAWQVFFYITLGRLLPLALLSGIWGVVVCAREIAATDLYQVGTLAEQLYLGYALNQSSAPAGNWTADQLAQAGHVGWTVTFSLFFALAAITTLAIGLFNRQIQENKGLKSTAPNRPPSKSFAADATAVLWLVLLVAVPLFNVVYRVGLAVELGPAGPLQNWQWDHALQAILRTVTNHRDALWWSMMIASVSSVVVLATAFVGCWLSRERWYYSVAVALTWVTLCGCSGPAIGIGISNLLAASELTVLIWLYDQTIFPAALANALFVWPIGVIGCWAIVSIIPTDQLDHAKTDNIGLLTRGVEFGIRQNYRALSGLLILLWTVSFGELAATQMVLPPGIETVPQVTLGKLHAGVDEETAAMTLLTTGLIVAIVWLGWIMTGIRHPHAQLLQRSGPHHR